MTSETLYIVRNNEGEITTLNKTPPNIGEYEALPPNHPDILRLLSQSEDNDIKNKLNLTDIEFIRVLDDLIDILIDRNIIHFTDFPGSDKKNFIHTLD